MKSAANFKIKAKIQFKFNLRRKDWEIRYRLLIRDITLCKRVIVKREREREREREATCRGDLKLMAATKELTQREAAYPNVWRTSHCPAPSPLGKKREFPIYPEPFVMAVFTTMFTTFMANKVQSFRTQGWMFEIGLGLQLWLLWCGELGSYGWNEHFWKV